MAINKFDKFYRWLSNFDPVQVYLDHVDYPSIEHAYQAAKTLVPDERLVIRSAGNATKAKKLGKKIKNLRPDWEEIKLGIMEDLVRQKFAPGSKHAHLLITTDGEELVEGNWWGDRFWGVCNGVGENHLGKILMKVRAELLEGK